MISKLVFSTGLLSVEMLLLTDDKKLKLFLQKEPKNYKTRLLGNSSVMMLMRYDSVFSLKGTVPLHSSV